MTIRYAQIMSLAYEQAVCSPDPSTQNGAVCLTKDLTSARGYGFNAPPDGFDCDLSNRELKLRRIAHAEASAIHAFPRNAKPHVLVCPWAACDRCAVSIALARIRVLIVHRERMEIGGHPEWKAIVDDALGCLKRNGCRVVMLEGPIETSAIIRISGRRWSPQTLEFVE